VEIFQAAALRVDPKQHPAVAAAAATIHIPDQFVPDTPLYEIVTEATSSHPIDFLAPVIDPTTRKPSNTGNFCITQYWD